MGRCRLHYDAQRGVLYTYREDDFACANGNRKRRLKHKRTLTKRLEHADTIVERCDFGLPEGNLMSHPRQILLPSRSSIAVASFGR